MGKQSRARVLADHQAMAIARNIRVSPRKLNLVAQQIRGKKVERALNELTFSQKRIAGAVKKALQSADRKSTRLNSSHRSLSRMPSSA